MDAPSVFALAVLPLVCFGYCRVVLMKWPDMTIFDLFAMAYSPSIGLPLIWFLCPIATMIVLGRIWGERDSETLVCRMRTRARAQAACVVDLVQVSVLCATIVQVSLVVIGAVFIGAPLDAGNPEGVFASMTFGRTVEGLSFPVCLVIMYVFSILSLITSNSLFLFLKSAMGSVPAFFIVSLVAYPEVHKATAFVHDVVSSYGGNSLAVNPISYLYDTASVSFSSWLPGQSHNLWFLIVVSALFLVAAFPFARRKEYRGARSL